MELSKIALFDDFGVPWNRKYDRITLKIDDSTPNLTFLAFLAQKASKVKISLFSGFWESSRKMRGPFFSGGGTRSWPGTAIVNHPLRQHIRRGLSYFPYIFYFVNFTISAAIRQGLFGSFENVIKEFRVFWHFCSIFNFLRGFFGHEIWHENVDFSCWAGPV